MLAAFRVIALIEGITTVALFLVAMPAKYWLDIPHLVPPVGWGHGMAWIAYMAAGLVTFAWYRAPVVGWARALLAGLVPFGTFINDGYVKRLAAARTPAA